MARKFYRNEDNSALRLHNFTALVNVAQVVETSPHKIISIEVDNKHTAYVHVKLYNKAAPTLGTDVPALSFSIQGVAGSAGKKRTFHFRNGSKRLFRTAMSIIATATEDSEDTQAAPAGGTVDVNVITEGET